MRRLVVFFLILSGFASAVNADESGVRIIEGADNEELEAVLAKDECGINFITRKDEHGNEVLVSTLHKHCDEVNYLNKLYGAYNTTINSEIARKSYEAFDHAYGTYKSASDALLEVPVAGFVWKQIPKPQEILIDAFWQSALDTLAGPYGTDNLGNNPAAKAFLRDGIKIISSLQKAELKIPVGGSKYFFDESRVASQVTKTVFKVGGIFFFHYAFKQPLKDASRMATFPGDIFSQTLVKAGQDRQDEMTRSEIDENDFKTYLINNRRITWLISGAVETVPKIYAMFSLGAIIAKSGLSEMSRNAVFKVSNLVLPGAYLGKTAAGWGHFYKTGYNNMGNGRLRYMNAIWSFPLAAMVHFGGFMVGKSVTTLLMAAPSRLIMGGIDSILKGYVYPGAEMVHDWWYSQADKGEPTRAADGRDEL